MKNVHVTKIQAGKNIIIIMLTHIFMQYIFLGEYIFFFCPFTVSKKQTKQKQKGFYGKTGRFIEMNTKHSSDS